MVKMRKFPVGLAAGMVHKKFNTVKKQREAFGKHSNS